VKHPDAYPVTPDYLENGCYQVEVMGKRYETVAYPKSPFDPKGKRLLGMYDEPLLVRQ
jgi:sarcosine dehydrogenase